MGFFKEFGAFVLGGKVEKSIDHLKEKMDETIVDMEKRVERATKRALKASVLFLMIFVGVLFMLIGIAAYLNATVPNLANGLGTVVVGIVLILLSLFTRFFRE